MSRRWTFLTLAMLPLLPATAGTEPDCTAYGWTVYEVTDSQGYPNPYRLALITRLRTSGGRTYPVPITVTKGLALCPGDKLDTWHGATTTLVRGNNVAGAVAESGSVLRFSDRIVQEAGTVTYLMPSGWGESIETTLKDGALLVSSMFSTVQVSMSGPTCDPTVEVSVSALDDPFAGGGATPNPKAHGAQLTILDAEGRPGGPSLELQGEESAQITPEGGLPERGGPTSKAAREVFQRSEPRLRAPLSQRGPPTAAERKELMVSEHRIVVIADAQPDALIVNGVPWAPGRWMSVSKGEERSWEAARRMRLPPGESTVEVTAIDGRRSVVVVPASEELLVDMRVRLPRVPTSAPLEPSSPSVALVTFETCMVIARGGPTGINHTPVIPGLDMVFEGLSAGQFCMGSPEGVGNSDEHPQRFVALSPFMIGRSEVTQAQWRTVVLAAQQQRDVDAQMLKMDPSYFKGDRLPVEQVSWCDAIRFANAISRLEGRIPFYRISGACDVLWVEGASGYRLPTEAEWEFAARAGTKTVYATGDNEDELAQAGWYDKNSSGRSHQVCFAPVQPWNLCDLHGNVWEWVWANQPGTYGLGTIHDPRDDFGEGGRRGGAWSQDAGAARSAGRAWSSDFGASWDFGFRLVLPVP